MDRRFILGLPLAGLAILAACSEPGPLDPALAPAFAVIGDQASIGTYTLCKSGTAADFSVTVDDDDAQIVHLADGECRDFLNAPLVGEHTVDVTELLSASYTLNHILDNSVTQQNTGGVKVYDSQSYPGPSISRTLNGDMGNIVVFYNDPVQPPTALGRMTGGGNPKINGVNLGLTLHCDITLSNNLEINWAGGNWHLDKPISTALCVDDPQYDPTPPAAGFNTFFGTATGRLDGVDGSFVKFKFVDAGEPGRNDRVTIQIWAPGDDPSSDMPVLELLDENLTHGNLQAHHDQPHGDHG